MLSIRRLNGEHAEEFRSSLARILVECVATGASVSFLAPFEQTEAEQFFARVIAEAQADRRILLGAFDGPTLIGTVQVVLDMPPNQPHRAEIAKLLVSPAARGKGAGAQLMRAAEQHAREADKTLLVLDTVTGDKAEALYTRLGWTKVGEIPNYALFPDGSPCATSVFYKPLD